MKILNSNLKIELLSHPAQAEGLLYIYIYIYIYIYMCVCVCVLLIAFLCKFRWELHKNAMSHIEESWKQYPTKQQLYCHPPPIFKSIQIRQTRHTGHCWRSKNEHISDILLWTPSQGRVCVGWPTRTCLHQIYRHRM